MQAGGGRPPTRPREAQPLSARSRSETADSTAARPPPAPETPPWPTLIAAGDAMGCVGRSCSSFSAATGGAAARFGAGAAAQTLLGRLGIPVDNWSAGTVAGVVSAAIALNILLCGLMACVVIGYVRALHGRGRGAITLPAALRGNAAGAKPRRSNYRRARAKDSPGDRSPRKEAQHSRQSTANDDDDILV